MRRVFVVPAVVAATLVSVSAGAQSAGAGVGFGSAPASLAGFSVVLVMGSQSGDLTSDGLPVAAAKALADLKDFLPYKSYRLLDTQWTIGSRGFVSRLRGAEGKEYALEMEVTQLSSTKVSASSFTLRDATVVPATVVERVTEVDVTQARAQLIDLEKRLAALRSANRSDSRLTSAERELKETLLAEVEARKRVDARTTGGAAISASFTMDIGETVVVGTSRLQGDKALIVLLTAVPKKAGASGGGSSR